MWNHWSFLSFNFILFFGFLFFGFFFLILLKGLTKSFKQKAIVYLFFGWRTLSHWIYSILVTRNPSASSYNSNEVSDTGKYHTIVVNDSGSDVIKKLPHYTFCFSFIGNVNRCTFRFLFIYG